MQRMIQNHFVMPVAHSQLLVEAKNADGGTAALTQEEMEVHRFK
jgi:hypothetical protein